MKDLIRASVLHDYPKVVASLGGEPAGLFSKFQIDPAVVNRPDEFVSFYDFIGLVNEAAEELDCPQFGLELSKWHDLSILGMLGLTMMNAPTVRDAMTIFSRFFYSHLEGGSIAFHVDGDKMIGTYTVDILGVESQRQVVDLSLGTGVNIYKFLCGPSTNPQGVYFMHGEPEDVSLYKTIFKCPLYFNAEFNGLVYPADILDRPLDKRDSEAYQRYLHNLQKTVAVNSDDVQARVEHAIKALLPTGSSSLDLVAASLNMSKRTLQKKLQEQGLNYQKLLDDVRSDIARAYIHESNVSMTRLADVLAYSELSTFSRAFKRWFGVSPKQWSHVVS